MHSNEIWRRLLDGNRRWVEDRSTAASDRGAVRRAATTGSQSPYALVLGCSDSRVPAEILFDQGIGDLFVVRTAGHVLDSAALGSVEYGVEVLGAKLLVVLGHEGCGAVQAATGYVDDAQVPPGHIRDVAERIAPHVLLARRAGATTADEIGRHHTLVTVDLLRQRSALIGAALHRGSVAAVAARYSLATGAVTEVRQPALAA